MSNSSPCLKPTELPFPPYHNIPATIWSNIEQQRFVPQTARALYPASFPTNSLVSPAGNCHHRGVWGWILCADLGSRLLLPIPWLEGKVKICPQAFLRHRWVLLPRLGFPKLNRLLQALRFLTCIWVLIPSCFMITSRKSKKSKILIHGHDFCYFAWGTDFCRSGSCPIALCTLGIAATPDSQRKRGFF